MSLSHLKQKLRDIVSDWDLEELNEEIRNKERNIEDNITQNKRNNNNTTTTIQSLYKTKEGLETELDIIKTKMNKKSQKSNETRLEAFGCAKRVIELEQEVARVETNLNDKQMIKKALEEEVEKLSNPSRGMLENTFFKGTGVDFIKSEGKMFARVKNKRLNDFYLVEINEEVNWDKVEQIWALMK